MNILRPLAQSTALLALLASPGQGATIAGERPTRLTLDSVNGATFSLLPEEPGKRPVPAILRAGVLLDRARFSPGSLDGLDGENFRKAVGAYQAATGLPSTARLDRPTWDRLTAGDPGPVLVERKLTRADVKGPFVKRIPARFEAQAGLKRLGYTSVVEAMSEQVHASPGLLRALNPAVGWTKPDQTVLVPQVVVARAAASVARIVVDKPAHAVLAYGADGKMLAYYPASIGSEEKPAPSGDFTVLRVTHNPGYTYNPKYAFKGVRSKKPFTIAPGPNNPVGSVWMDLSDEGYGIHGTPEPDLVGKTQSHGCIRMTNWDVEDLASMVAKDTPVTFQDRPSTPVAPPSETVPVAPPPTPALPSAPPSG